MRISTTHKFCFIANPQCASTSIRRMFDDWSDIKSSTVTPQAGRLFRHHTSAADTWAFLTDLGQDPHDYFFFSSIRNPWNRMVSRYFYGLRHDASTWATHARVATTFADFVKDPGVQAKSMEHRYQDYLCDGDRKIVDFVIRVEQIDADVQTVCQRLGLPAPAPVHTNQNRPADADYRSHYDDASRAIVGQIFAQEIALFGYQF